ncbi:MAG: hypothetical protein K0S33_3277 [Bacteroidetes bacterium]|nr:hypothetical protein [Bacteroidota bacterium]
MVASTLLLFIGSAYAYNHFFADRIVAEGNGVELSDRNVLVNLKPLDPDKPQQVDKPHYSQKTDAPATVIKDNADPEPDKKLALNAPPSKGSEGDTTDVDPEIGDPAGKGIAAVVPPIPDPVEVPTLMPDEMPAFPGGQKAMMEFFSKHVVYPERSKVMGNQGTVFVNFVVGKDGKIISCKIVKGVDEDCNEEALRVVGKMPAWKPGKTNGKEVPVMFNLPIRFRLD